MATARVDIDAGERIPVPSVKCDPPAVAVRAYVEYQADGSAEWVPFGSGDATGTVTPLLEQYPDCYTPAGTLICQIDLQRKDGTRWESCGEVAIYCPDWVREWSETPDLFRCKYGSYDVAMSMCSAYRKPGTLLPNHEEDEDGVPQPVPPGAPAPDPMPNPVRDPDTGNEVDLGTIVDVDGATNTSPDGQSCFPTGWGVINPVSWVLMPVQCALKWAFVPRAVEIQKKMDALRLRANGWVVPAVGVVTTIAGAVKIAASGCQGPPMHLVFDFPGFTAVDETYYPMNACEDPMASVASAVNGMLSFSIIAWMGLAVVRYFMSLIGYVPFGGGAPESESKVRFKGGDD
jgi:hypothetical protein